MKEESLETPECYANIKSGDLFIIWHPQNRPVGDDWVRISLEAYDVWTGSNFHIKKKGEL
jgi:hypothetical protein